jgi:hypothetical protein
MLGRRPHVHRKVRIARRERGRHVFLDRDLALEARVGGEVDDAETAFTENPVDLEFAQDVSRGQMSRSTAVSDHRAGEADGFVA